MPTTGTLRMVSGDDAAVSDNLHNGKGDGQCGDLCRLRAAGLAVAGACRGASGDEDFAGFLHHCAACSADVEVPPRKAVHLAVLHCFKMFLLFRQSGSGSNICEADVSQGVSQMADVWGSGTGVTGAVWG